MEKETNQGEQDKGGVRSMQAEACACARVCV